MKEAMNSRKPSHLHAHIPESRQLLLRTSSSNLTSNKKQQVSHETHDLLDGTYKTTLARLFPAWTGWYFNHT
jgi:hypothetical protein